MTRARRLLVTGAAGFVGTNFLARVKDRPGLEVIGVVHRRAPLVTGANIRYVEADLRRLDDCHRVTAGIDQVCMFAGRLSNSVIMARQPLGPVTENTVINAQMLEAASEAGVRTFLWLSSTTGYPDRGRALTEDDFFAEDPPAPYAPPGWMSRYIEKLAGLYATRTERPMSVISLRPTALFGEYDDFDYETCHALPAIMRRVMERQSPVEIWDGADDERDWLYIDDFLDACLLALERITTGHEALNVGTGQIHSLRHLLDTMLDLDGYAGARVVSRPRKLAAAATRRLDCSRAERLLGFSAKTAIEDALAQTMKWYREARRT